MRPGRRTASAALVLAAFAAAGAATARVADRERVELKPADQAAAKAAVLKRTDLGSSPGWSGGATKPELAPEFPCASYHPKQSDLVLTGAAESRFRHSSGVQFDSEAQVLQTARMVALDWQRTVTNPAVLPCLRAALAKQAGPNEKLVSMAARPFPKLSTYTRAYRALIDVTSSARRIRIMVDLVLVGRSRTELTLSTTAPYAAHAAIEPAEVHLARALVARARA